MGGYQRLPDEAIVMDYYLTGKDRDSQRMIIRMLLLSYKKDGFKGGQFNLDGTEPTGNYAGGLCRHGLFPLHAPHIK